MIFSSHILKNYLCIYSFILLLCWASGCFGCGEPGLLFLAARRLLIVVFSLVAEQELQGMQVSVLVVLRLSCSTVHGIFPDQGSNRVPCIGRWILNHWTTREVPWIFLEGDFSVPCISSFQSLGWTCMMNSSSPYMRLSVCWGHWRYSKMLTLPNRHKQKKCDATTGSLWSCGTWISPHKSCDFGNCPSLTELQFSYL